MSAGHKRRFARLWASIPTPDEAKRQEVERREGIRWRAMLCAFIRAAMERRGIDPDSAPALYRYEAETKHKAERIGFVDMLELQAADAAFRAAHPKADHSGAEGPREWLMVKLDGIAGHFVDGSWPDFACCSLPELWAWAMLQARLARTSAAAENPPAQAGEGSAA